MTDHKSARTCWVHLIKHIFQLAVGRVLTQWPHHRAQLPRRDGAVAVFVEQCEAFLQLCVSMNTVLLSLRVRIFDYSGTGQTFDKANEVGQ